MFAVALMSTSCEKDDPIVPEPTGPITLAELDGIWVSTQYEYDKTYYVCEDLENITTAHADVLAGDLMLVTLIIGTSWELDSKCTSVGTNGNGVNYDFDAQTLELENAGIQVCKFDVKSYDRVSDILVLELTHDNMGTVSPPIGGKYTLKK